MVNAKNLLTTGVVALAVAAIVTYMTANGLTTKDVTLVDACFKAAQVKGINTETCEQFKEQNYEWDTKVPCVKAFKEDVYYWTPRMMFAYYSGGKSDISALGRKNKGTEKEVIYTAAMNLSYAEALNDRCAPAAADEQYPVYQVVYKQIAQGVPIDQLDLSELQDRNLYSFGQALSWIASAVGGAIARFWKKTTQGAVNSANYRACSVGLALAFASGGIVDTAECSGNHPGQCKKYHGSVPWGWWSNHSRGGNNRLNNGCNTHDKCLQNGNNGWWCDETLKNNAYHGINWKWPGVSCGWRGCRSWWFAWRYSMGDSRFVSGCVYITMGFHPNR